MARYVTRLGHWPTNPPTVGPVKFGWVYKVAYKKTAYDTLIYVKTGWRPTRQGAAYAAVTIHGRYFATGAAISGEQYDDNYWRGGQDNDWFNAHAILDEHEEKEDTKDAVKQLKKSVKELS